MRIEPKVVVPVSPETREPKAQAEKPAQAPAPASVVKLSEAGQASQADIAKASEDASARVASIRASIRSGTYPIDLDKLAAKIVGDEVFREVTR